MIKYFRPYALPKVPLFNFVLVGMVCMAALWTPVQAGEGNAPVDLSTAIRRVAEQNMPAVVHIRVTRRQEVTNPFLPFENDPSFRYFFNVPRMSREFKRGLKGLGTLKK